jgi:thiol:disulfide interchange protein
MQTTRMTLKKTFLLLTLLALQLMAFSQLIDPVKWKFEAKKISKAEFELIFTASIDQPWHMYGMYIPSNGPIATTLHFEAHKGYELIGKPSEVSKPEEKFDPNFRMKIALHSKKAIFRQVVKTISIPVLVKGTIEYQSCNDRQCLLPVEKGFEINLSDGNSETPAKSESTTNSTENKSITLASTGLSFTSDSLKKSGKPSIIDNKENKLSGATISENSKSMWGFFLLSFLGGLLGILTPCVFPMIPMTVSFFMRGSENRRKAILNGIIFGLSIILIYTLVGVIVALTSAGADFANQLSTHWIPNLIFFLLFIVFASSFLGMFEIILPTGLTNKADQQVDKGGAFASFFMALTLVLVSFSCTGPIIGALLVEAANGQVLKPVIGMFGFSFAFALPFTLFAIFPSWLKSLPKSGGWLNSVKVVMGLILLAFGLKFLSNIDQAYHLHFLGREIYLSIWIVLFFILGLYLLGKIRFVHDSETTHIKVPRFLLAVTSFSFVVYMIPGLFGAPLSGISTLIPPKTGHSFDLLKALNTTSRNSESQINALTKLCDQPKYADILEMPYDLKGYFDIQQGLACAKKLNKPVFLDLKGHT